MMCIRLCFLFYLKIRTYTILDMKYYVYSLYNIWTLLLIFILKNGPFSKIKLKLLLTV